MSGPNRYGCSSRNFLDALLERVSEICWCIEDGKNTRGILKDTLLVKANTEAELGANRPGLSLFHCHQQDHMDAGFMMLFRYA